MVFPDLINHLQELHNITALLKDFAEVQHRERLMANMRRRLSCCLVWCVVLNELLIT